jgi:hypothetical protein
MGGRAAAGQAILNLNRQRQTRSNADEDNVVLLMFFFQEQNGVIHSTLKPEWSSECCWVSSETANLKFLFFFYLKNLAHEMK